MDKARLIARLAKLKKLAECPTGNQNETATAAAMMQKLMLEHDIQEIELAEAAGQTVEVEPIEELVLPGLGKNQGQWEAVLLAGLAKANHCIAWKYGDSLHLLGETDKMATVNYLYQFCCREIKRLSKDFCRGKDKPKAHHRAYCLGAASAIYRRVQDERYNLEQSLKGAHSKALMVIDQAHERLDEALQRRGLQFGKSRGGKISHMGSYLAGDTAGRQMALNGGKQGLKSGSRALGPG